MLFSNDIEEGNYLISQFKIKLDLLKSISLVVYYLKLMKLILKTI